jgi:hypothetical protein
MVDVSLSNNTPRNNALAKAFDLVQSQFGSLPLNCVSLDSEMKRLQQAIIDVYKMPLTYDEQGNANIYQEAYKEQLLLKKANWENIFANHKCRDVIENIRLASIANTETTSAIKQEASILGTSTKNENLYIGIGAVILLVGLFIVLEK